MTIPNFSPPKKVALNPLDTPNKLFFPTLEDTKSVWFWFGLVIALSLYDVFSQFQYLPQWTQAFTLFFKTFASNFCIIFGTVGYLHFSVASFQSLPLKAQLIQLTLVNLLMTPLMTLLAKLIVFVVLQDAEPFQDIFIAMVINTFLAILVTALLVYYFATQYRTITATQQRYQQKLLEQNTQLKARITPHFFFNMLNTLQSLVESEPRLASNAINSVAKLYRLSFNEPREIALTDEITLCEEYLSIEKYRFADRLQVTWELPDEDLLYDMVITSLTLQMLIEKMITTVVELTSQAINIHIAVGWENNWVDIRLITTLPNLANFAQPSPRNVSVQDESSILASEQLTSPQLKENLSFQAQEDNLQRHFGTTAHIDYRIEARTVTSSAIVIQVHYPLADVG